MKTTTTTAYITPGEAALLTGANRKAAVKAAAGVLRRHPCHEAYEGLDVVDRALRALGLPAEGLALLRAAIRGEKGPDVWRAREVLG